MDLKSLWEFKYAPQNLDEMILHSDVKTKLKKALQEYPNMVLVGNPGVGKGTFVDILKKTSGFEFFKINASRQADRGIAAIEDKVMSFGSAAGLGKLKYVYLNEADSLTLEAQKALRDYMENVHKLTRFVFACNYGEKIIPELKSRCQWIEISNPPMKDIAKFIINILKKEKVKYKAETVVDIVKYCYPDIRNTIINTRMNVVDGVLPEKIVFSTNETIFEEILNGMKSGDPAEVRKVLKSQIIDYTALYNYLYQVIMERDKVFKMDAEAIILIGEHSYRDKIVDIGEINFMHMVFKMLKGDII